MTYTFLTFKTKKPYQCAFCNISNKNSIGKSTCADLKLQAWYTRKGSNPITSGADYLLLQRLNPVLKILEFRYLQIRYKACLSPHLVINWPQLAQSFPRKSSNTASPMIARHARDFTWNRGCSSNSPPLMHGNQIPHPLEDSDNQIPFSPGRQKCQMPRVCPGGMLKLRSSIWPIHYPVWRVAESLTWDQALFFFCLFASLLLWLEREKKNAWYIYLTSHQPPPNLHKLTSAWPVMLSANQRLPEGNQILAE